MIFFFNDLRSNDEQRSRNIKLDCFNREFAVYIDMYDKINAGRTLQEIVTELSQVKELSIVFAGFRKVSEQYGNYHNIARREYNLGIAQYLKKNSIMAIISEDTDFLIFDGPWRLWSPLDIKITESNRIKISEYNRNAVANVLRLSQSQLPFFATLSGNYHTRRYSEQLYEFNKQLPSRIGRFGC